MILTKLKELNIPFNIRSIVCDYELNIQKAINEILENVEIHGCFYHLSETLYRRVVRKGFKQQYDDDIQFRKFVEHCSAIAHLPLTDLETGLEWIADNHSFEDEKTIFYFGFEMAASKRSRGYQIKF